MRNVHFSSAIRRAIPGVALCIVLAGCGGGDGSDETGTLSLSITDQPLDDARSVVVQFSAIAFKHEGSAPEFIEDLEPSPRQINLLDYQQGRAAILLQDVTLRAGHYEWLRLIVDVEPNVRDSYIELNSGAECELWVPSGAETGLKLIRGFDLPADGSAALTVHFDLSKSIIAPPGQSGSGLDCTQQYLLKPTLRLVKNADVGAIAGQVDATLVTEGCLPKVYVFEGADAVPDDNEEESQSATDVDPLVVARVEVVNGATQYDYKAAFLPAGTYTVAFTCDDDNADIDEVLTFSPTQNARCSPT
jgi:hypothetical protein